MSISDSSRSKVGGKRERTRAALVAAALEVVASKGFAAASLDEIAGKAGMTKGAIYSNFDSKAELLLAAMGAKGLTLSSPRTAGMTLTEELMVMAKDLAETLGRAKGEEAFLAEFQFYALSDPDVRESFAASYGAGFTQTAEYLSGLKGATPDMAPRHLAVALQAIALGFMVQSFITPGDVTETVVFETLKALAAGLSRTGAAGMDDEA
jgi:AcrR family transcriptional regulator